MSVSNIPSSSLLVDRSIISKSIFEKLFMKHQSLKLYFEYDCVNEMKTYEMCMSFLESFFEWFIFLFVLVCILREHFIRKFVLLLTLTYTLNFSHIHSPGFYILFAIVLQSFIFHQLFYINFNFSIQSST